MLTLSYLELKKREDKNKNLTPPQKKSSLDVRWNTIWEPKIIALHISISACPPTYCSYTHLLVSTWSQWWAP